MIYDELASTFNDSRFAYGELPPIVEDLFRYDELGITYNNRRVLYDGASTPRVDGARGRGVIESFARRNVQSGEYFEQTEFVRIND